MSLGEDLPLILCGDLNVHLSKDDTDGIRYRETAAWKTLSDVILSYDLVDIWRVLNPGKKRFTWRRCQPMQQSRIDYFLLSSMLYNTQKVVKAEIEPGVKSDHSMVLLEIAVVSNKWGPGLLRFNTSLLENGHWTDQIKEEIQVANRREGQYTGLLIILYIILYYY